jgi:MSHA biogenesis protein MshQ
MSGNDNVTPSYATAGSANGGTSHTTETATLTHALIAPAAGDAGALGGTKSFVRDTFTSGVKTLSDLTWSEVGVLTIKADATKFMGVAHATTGTSNNAGRFIPDHFDTVATGPMACAPNAGCVSPVTTMAYSGQPFSVTVRAKKAGGTHVSGDATEITTNYKGSFAHDVTLGTAATGGSLTVVTITGASFSSGTASDATPKFTFTSATPPSAPTDVLISAPDADVATSSAHEGGLKVVSGRIKIGNAYGSELIPLTVPVNVQYYDGTLWRNSTTDSTTQIDTTLGNNIVRSGALTGLSTVSGGVKTVQSGVLRNFKMAAPGAKGKATLSAASVGGDVDFLLPNSVPGEVTFGIYAAKQPFIYLRESY